MQISREEFERLALEQLDLIDRMARSMTRDSAEAEDLVQETFVRAVRAWPSFDLREHGIRPWLVRILHNLHVSRRVRESKQPQSASDPDLERAANAVNGSESSELEKWESNEELRQAMGELPAELRAALNLWAVEGFSYQEMADAFGIPIGTVMSRLHRAKRLLREAYNHRMRPEPRIDSRGQSYRKDAPARP
jgi:RNA polymerase sigma-70 factor (ECF subfamily)